MASFPRLERVNESNIIVYFGAEIDERLPAQIAGVVNTLVQLGDKIVDLTPSYTSLLITFNPVLIAFDSLYPLVENSLAQIQSDIIDTRQKLVEIPVYYATESGLDLEDTAEIIGASIEEVIELHCRIEYTVFALGFMPGFAFMGTVDERLRLPRLSTPRTKVPEGSVAITEQQTAVYPKQTPGGWRVLGRSPMRLFDANQNPPQPYQIGDKVKFQPISRDDFFRLGGVL